MTYTKQERIDIAEQVVRHELTYKSASERYAVSIPTIANWVRMYKKINNIVTSSIRIPATTSAKDLETLQSLSKEELIDEVIKARIGEERAKKGYEVKGGGQSKEYVSLFSKNTK